jgi:hypothetical protein
VGALDRYSSHAGIAVPLPPKSKESPNFFSEARYSLTSVGTITLSIQLFHPRV